VIGILCSVGVIEWHRFGELLFAGWLFKAIIAAIDTPLLYASTWGIRKYFGLKGAEEFE